MTPQAPGIVFSKLGKKLKVLNYWAPTFVGSPEGTHHSFKFCLGELGPDFLALVGLKDRAGEGALIGFSVRWAGRKLMYNQKLTFWFKMLIKTIFEKITCPGAANTKTLMSTPATAL